MKASPILKKFTSLPYSPFIIIGIFIIVKLFHLNVSFFWDESWVYAPAIRTLADAGPSLLPDAIPLDYSRGHPLLFHFLGSVWIKLFGPSFVSMHSFALAISVIFLVFTERFFTTVFNRNVSFWVILIFCVQEIFIAQSSIVLPEMLLATCTIAAIFYYQKQNWIAYIIAGTLTVLTKETGILIIICIAIFDFVLNLRDRKSILSILKKGILLCIPLLTLAGHMLYLKSVFGWYLYPEHTGMVKSDFWSIASSLSHVIYDQIFSQKRFLVTLPFVALYLYELIAKRSFINIIGILLCLILSGYFVVFHDGHFIVSLFYTYCLIHLGMSAVSRKDNRFQIIGLLVLFIFIYALFSAANFYTVRYLLSTLIFTIAVPIYYLLSHHLTKKWIGFYFIPLSFLYVFLASQPNKTNDINLSYLYYCPAQLEVVQYLEDNNLYESQINTLFLMSVALDDPYAGYRSTGEKFKYISKENNEEEDYFVFYNVEPDGRREQLQNDPKAELLERIEKRHIWFEIWKVTH